MTSDLPPPPVALVAKSPRWPWLFGVIVVVLFVGGIANVLGGDDKDDDGGRRMTLVEAACGMLDDGEDPDTVYDVMKRLAADHPLVYGEDESVAARAAVTQAQAQGCG